MSDVIVVGGRRGELMWTIGYRRFGSRMQGLRRVCDVRRGLGGRGGDIIVGFVGAACVRLVQGG
jgi:hypothetical protein